MLDQFGRQIEYLRISVTQNCNLKCLYCRPDEEEDGSGCTTNLTPEEYGKIVRAMVSLGIHRVRITGGEPLIRRDICEIIEHISKIEGIEDLSLSTNGIHLGKMAGSS
jgi:cyclic pyranopterin phosphate synthase